MICKNNKCKKEFDEKIQKVIFINKIFKGFKCPHCNKKYYWIPKQSTDYIRLDNGQLIRKNKKIRMSKKERLNKRRELKEEIRQ